MGIDWGMVATIASPLVALVVGFVLTRTLNRPVVTTYLGHTSAHRADAVAGGQRFDVFTHSLVIQNTGWRSASNVKLAHSKLPSFSVYPDVEYRVSDLPGGGQEILFPSLVPNEQVTVSYLYIPPGNLGSDQPRGQVRLDLCFRRDVGKGNLPLFTLQSKSSTEA